MLIGKRRLGRGVAVVGAGMSHFGAFKDKASRDLFVDGFIDMQDSVDKGLDPGDIQHIFVGNFSSDLFEGQGHLAPLMAEWVGLTPCPATRVEDACASGGVALRQGVMAIASGMCDVVLVGGVEKMTSLPTERVTDTLAAASDILYEASAGFTFPGLYAAMATAYMARYELGTEPFMRVAIKNHQNGALNPKAQFNSSLKDLMEARRARAKERGQPVPEWQTEMDFLNDPAANPIVAWPMRLFDCSPITDGAACLLLVAEEIAGNFTDRPLRLIGSGQGSDTSLLTRSELTSIGSARVAARQAYEMAGVAPSDIKVAEVHDCFTIAELIATEDLGFFAPGEGARAAVEGRTAREGDRPVNTSGGLKSKGHPVGASGVGQVVEIWHQMRGEAGERQLRGRDVDLGLAHNVGGTGSTCVVHIFERR
jgi:acetyl-CoA C-acetyltransferase